MISWKYKGGLLLIVMVVILWVTSAEVTQGVYTEYNHPFAVAYLATSLFVVHLPIAFIKDWLMGILMRCYCRKSEDGADQTVDEESAAELDASAKHNGLHSAFEIEHQEPLGNECSCTYIYSENVKLLVSESTNKIDKVKEDKNITTREIAKFGFCVAPLWFITEYLTDAALARTTVASTTLLSSTSAPFTLLIGACLGQDSINLVKAIAVVVSMAGVVMTAFGKTSTADETQKWEALSSGRSFCYSLVLYLWTIYRLNIFSFYSYNIQVLFIMHNINVLWVKKKMYYSAA